MAHRKAIVGRYLREHHLVVAGQVPPLARNLGSLRSLLHGVASRAQLRPQATATIALSVSLLLCLACCAAILRPHLVVLITALGHSPITFNPRPQQPLGHKTFRPSLLAHPWPSFRVHLVLCISLLRHSYPTRSGRIPQVSTPRQSAVHRAPGGFVSLHHMFLSTIHEPISLLARLPISDLVPSGQTRSIRNPSAISHLC